MAKAKRLGVLKMARIRLRIGDMLEDHDMRSCHEVVRDTNIPDTENGRVLVFRTVNPDIEGPFFHSVVTGCQTTQGIDVLLKTADVVRRANGKTYQRDESVTEDVAWRELAG